MISLNDHSTDTLPKDLPWTRC
uniref:Uncharacterized protein n=1 Tax=Arundo donax TaxID=35708 RepID=A0A0A9A361_ARUDO